jgi:hypothetical protein
MSPVPPRNSWCPSFGRNSKMKCAFERIPLLTRNRSAQSSSSSLEPFRSSSTEGIEENLNRRQQRKQRRIVGWVSVIRHPLGPSATVRFSNRRRPRLKHFDQSSTEGIEENLNRRQQRKQRRIEDLGFCDGHPPGSLAPWLLGFKFERA